MRILEILEKERGELFVHTLCYTGINAAGKASFNGTEKELFLLPPGGFSSLPDSAAGFVLPVCEFPGDFFFSAGEALFRTVPSSLPFPKLRAEMGGFLTVSSRASFLRPLRAGVLTVSDKGSRGEREDTSGPALAERLRGIGCDTAETAVVPDENEAIAAILKNWTDLKDLHLILCTGGTGFSPRDITPEVLESIAGRKVPGIGEAMRQASLRITPKAMLSRSNAVIRGETLIISLPGSAKGATECFDAIAGPLRHGIEILRGWDGECGSPS
ncbi:molybdenum cofactor synthesis domain-containing protein [Aminivibrio pyruvatiphilus]|jgi:molybdopterin adenylyltransferase|uniref:Molybdenum cofactor synthesis domain-containing protein n=1 Tax=Aminivibrio pyruvatiphilus TaxID=1005740 RepID=A0A4R8M1N8_9BACT|nr:MogA/MoaB family molybdenum cofactor biosynthesis protein [Aminivibrio pyruvatiphilus]TDY56066.1 molybdenum cofactor synthesis domain-containing protein [Aminivibrio pyruvatiphilus]